VLLEALIDADRLNSHFQRFTAKHALAEVVQASQKILM
jgi:hypothetical protein